MPVLTPNEIEAVRSTIPYLQRLAETFVPSRERGNLAVTIDILRELLANAEEQE